MSYKYIENNSYMIELICDELKFEHDCAYIEEEGLLDILLAYQGQYGKAVFDQYVKMVNSLQADTHSYKLWAWLDTGNSGTSVKCKDVVNSEEDGCVMLPTLTFSLYVKGRITKGDCIDVANICNGWFSQLETVLG